MKLGVAASSAIAGRLDSPPSPKASARQPSLIRYQRAGLACPAVAREASEGWWGKKDSNLRSHKTADLQSAPFATRDTPPLEPHRRPPAQTAAGRPWMTLIPEADGELPVGRVYGRSRRAKSTKAGANTGPKRPKLPLSGTHDTSWP
jgi:hypothetical protein